MIKSKETAGGKKRSTTKTSVFSRTTQRVPRRVTEGTTTKTTQRVPRRVTEGTTTTTTMKTTTTRKQIRSLTAEPRRGSQIQNLHRDCSSKPSRRSKMPPMTSTTGTTSSATATPLLLENFQTALWLI